MLKFMTDNGSLCWAGGYFFRKFAGRSFRQKIIFILLITATALGSTTSPASPINQADKNEILLQNRQFIPEVAAKLSISKITGHAIIQFEEHPDDTIIDTLASHQVNILEWIPRNAVMAYIPETAQVESIPGIRWVGKLNPTDKISAHLNQSLTKGFVLIDVYPDVTDQRARSVIFAVQGEIIENHYLAPKTYLVRATEEIATNLSMSDEVSWIWPASDAIINGEPVYYCPGPMTAFGLIVPNYCVHDDGWDGPGLGSASLKYYFGTGTSDTLGEWDEVEDALYEWAKYAQITWTRTYLPNQNRSVDIKWGTGSHGGCPHPFERALGHSFYPSPPNSEPIAGDIHINDEFDWRDYCSSYYWDVYTVVLHEIGHSLGLCHSSNTAAVMYKYASINDCFTGLHQDDIDGIRSIYAYRCYSCFINVTSPSSGSVWECGNCYYITWNSECNRGNKVKIELYKGSSLVQTITSSTSDDGSHYWCVPADMTPASNYRIKISNKSDSSCSYDWSSYFEISCDCVRVTSPSSSSVWECNRTYPISWSRTPHPTDMVDIWLTKGGGWWTLKRTEDDGSYNWKVPTWLEPDCGYWVMVKSTLDSSCYGESDTFCITCPCAITVTSPDGGCWEVGEVYDINWISENTSGNVKIDLYKGGSLDRVITPSTPDTGTGSYAWSVPVDGSLTGDCDYRIKVTDVLSSSCDGYSAYFCIATPPEAQDDTVTTSKDTPVMITLQATDEGCPDPPAALTYIIMSLPSHGDLNDPCSGWIDSVPYTLAGYGNEVEYMPDIGYEDQDSFTFKANDGGVPPGGGDSNEAIITIDVLACTTIPIGTGTSTWDYPMHTYYHDSRTQVIYLASEIGMPGIITDLALDVTTAPGQTMNNWTIRMKHTALSEYSTCSLDATGWTIVYQNDESPGSTGWRTFTFSSPFEYNGTDNLLVDFSHNNSSYTSNGECMASSPGGTRSAYAYSDSGYDDPLNWSGTTSPTVSCSTYVPNVQLTICVETCLDEPNLHAEPNTTQGTCNTIYWDPAAGANEYYAECANDVNFDNIDANSGWIADVNYEFCGLTSGQTYWYRVKARTAESCESNWSNVESSLQCGTPGDFEPDCDVDMDDLAILCEQWLLGELLWDVWPEGGDGFVNFLDWAIFADGWQTTVDYDDLAGFVDQWLQSEPYGADIAPAPDGDGTVNFLDFAEFAIHWLEGAE